MNWMWTEFSECVCVHCTLQCMWVAQSSPGGAGSLVVASTCCLCLAHSAEQCWEGCCVLYLGWGWGWEGKGINTVRRKGRDSVLAVVTADKLGLSCLLPALTCRVELCTDHTCIWTLGTVGSAWGTSMLYQPYIYMCTDVGRPCFHHIYIV